MTSIRIGTASWADPGFIKDWYPPGLPPGHRLPYYARHFDYVELNSSFYAVPLRNIVEKWERSTPPGFTFDVKLHKSLSRHAFEAATLPKPLQLVAKAGKAALTPELEAGIIASFLDAFHPLEQAGKLGAFLLQMSPAFSPRKHALPELDSLLRQLAPRPMAVELRNRNWMTGGLAEETARYFAARNVTLVSVDAPSSEHFTVMPAGDRITAPALAYLRLHGRNEKGYLSGKTVEERFDYDYSDAELEEIGGRVKELAAQAREVHVVFNNNRSDYAPGAAERFRRLLGQIPTQPEHRKISTNQEDFRF